MSTQLALQPEIASLPISGRLSDYVQMSRPKIGVMVLVTAGLGMLLAGESISISAVILMLVGTALVTTGASIFNQLGERHTDGLMKRTENRPLPAGRVGYGEVFIVGTAITFVGLALLCCLPVGPAAAIVAAATFVLYVFVYTPAKRHTEWNTLIGAVPGAMPPLIGWAAAKGTLSLESLPLFAILFLWQVPHFLAIAWIYRDDYRLAGLKMIPVRDSSGIRTARAMIGYAVVLLIVSLWPLAFGAGWAYAIGSILLGVAFLASTVRFESRRTIPAARSVLKMSLLYLPAVLLVLFLDRVI